MDRNQGHTAGPQRDPNTEILGPYALVAEIARGELTTVHLAYKHGALGFHRLVAVKRLTPEFAHDPECVQLILDEARLTAGLHHANVSGVLDVGSDAGCYVVMDYIEGENLDVLLTRAGKERNSRYVAPVVVDMLNGLHAVHTAVGEDGSQLGMVHQAPTARHVMVGIDGTARLIDFSQARARLPSMAAPRRDRLKLVSMAPEQVLEPERVDHRTDLFIVGVLLWEALTGESLFGNANGEQTLQNLLQRHIPRPSEVGLKPPRCFDAIVLRALERDPKQRYANALEMARHLRDTALNQALYATAGELGEWVKELAGDGLIERRRLAGGDAPPEDLRLDLSDMSGFHESPRSRVDQNPYGTGRIYGGSYSRIPGVDPDKTPAFGVRASQPPSEQDAAATARPNTRQNRADTPSGARISTPPSAPEPDTLPGRPSASPSAKARPSQPDREERRASAPPSLGARARSSAAPERPFARSSAPPPVERMREDTLPYKVPTVSPSPDLADLVREEEAENTNPAVFVPSRPGSRRDRRTRSPGAYSEVKGNKKRTSSPDVAAQDGLFEESDTTKVSAAASAAAREQGDKARARPSTPGALPRAVSEESVRKIARTDSTPQRLSIPDGPVGSPYHSSPPGAASPDFELPSVPRAIEQLHGRTRVGDVIAMPPDSLTPPATAARTRPPPRPDEVPSGRSRGLGFWVGTGALAGIIALAGVVGVRNWVEQRGAVSRSVATPLETGSTSVSPAKVPAAASAPAAVVKAPAQHPKRSAGVTVPAKAAPPVKGALPAKGAEVQVSKGFVPAKPLPGAVKMGMGASFGAAKPKPAAVVTASSQGKPAGNTKAVRPIVQTIGPHLPMAQPPSRFGSSIPDNPY